MTASQVLYHPLTTFGICVLCGWLLYQFGRAISPATQAVGDKLDRKSVV